MSYRCRLRRHWAEMVLEWQTNIVEKQTGNHEFVPIRYRRFADVFREACRATKRRKPLTIRFGD